MHVISPLYESESQASLKMANAGSRELLLFLPRDDEQLIPDLRFFVQTERYVLHNTTAGMSPSRQQILLQKGKINARREKDIKKRLESLLARAELVVGGETFQSESRDFLQRLEEAFEKLIGRVYPHAFMVGSTFNESMLLGICTTPQTTLDNAVSEAERVMADFVRATQKRGLRSTVKNLLEHFAQPPYGWPYAAILCVLAKLCVRGTVEARLDSNTLDGEALASGLKNTAQQERILLYLQSEYTPRQLQDFRRFVGDLLDKSPSAQDPQSIARELNEQLVPRLLRLEDICGHVHEYPFVAALEPVLKALRTLRNKPTPWYLTELPQLADTLLDNTKYVADPILEFWNSREKEIYDTARRFLQEQRVNLKRVPEKDARQIESILAAPNCYRDDAMQRLKGLVETLQQQISQQRAQALATVTAAAGKRKRRKRLAGSRKEGFAGRPSGRKKDTSLMDTTALKKIAQAARRSLHAQVAARLDITLAPDGLVRRESPKEVQKLEKVLVEEGRDRLVERVAYTWFNRFCALRFMDVHGYTSPKVLTPAPGDTRPEILAEASAGLIDETFPLATRRLVEDLLLRKRPSPNPQDEAYRQLLVAACNAWGKTMPFLFHPLRNSVELLLPTGLLSEHAIVGQVRAAMTEDACQNVEVIGWLYQFYISEQKDTIFKSKSKIAPQDIPAATQLFTPHWIVRYLVENSLGCLWMLNHPHSTLLSSMPYYIAPEQAPEDFLRIETPEAIRICDPCCGSGHMLVYAFDLLYKMYEEKGYAPSDIPGKILRHNLYGIEIDKRAAALAAFALTMKARARQRSFFRQSPPVKPHICALRPVRFSDEEIRQYMGLVGHDLLTHDLRTTLGQFDEANNFGSLICPDVKDAPGMRKLLEKRDATGSMVLYHIHKRVLEVLEMADYLRCKYHVVVTNPPYMGRMNTRLASWLKEHYQDARTDVFAAFVVRNTKLALRKGQLGFMTPFVWMFISSYEKLRQFLIKKKTITSLVQLEYSGFDGATVPICAFTVENMVRQGYKGAYIRLSDFRGPGKQGPKTLEAIANPKCGWFYRACAEDFQKIPGSPVAYWVKNTSFFSEKTIGKNFFWRTK